MGLAPGLIVSRVGASCLSVDLILLFYFSFAPSVFLFRCVSHSLPLSLSSCLGCNPLLLGLPFFRSLLRRMFFLPYVCVSCG